MKALSVEDISLITNTVRSVDIDDLKQCAQFGVECDDGEIEFKLKIVSPSLERIQRRISQMVYRLNEGNGRCVYEIGVEDDGNPKGLSDRELIETLKTIFRINKELGGEIEIASVRKGQSG